MHRRTLALLATAGTAALLAACSSASDTSTDQAPPTSPASPSPTPTATVPTLSRWVGVACTPEGSTAKTTSGGDLVCKKVGSDRGPVWHAVAP